MKSKKCISSSKKSITIFTRCSDAHAVLVHDKSKLLIKCKTIIICKSKLLRNKTELLKKPLTRFRLRLLGFFQIIIKATAYI